MRTSIENTPLTFDLNEDLYKKLKGLQKDAKARTLSEVIRYSLLNFNYLKFKKKKSARRQLSVRLPADIKKEIYTVAQQQGVSAGELLRVAIEKTAEKSLKPQLLQQAKRGPTKADKVIKAKKPMEEKKILMQKAVKKQVASTATKVKKTTRKVLIKRKK